jgi:antirestriction protein ArdC
MNHSTASGLALAKRVESTPHDPQDHNRRVELQFVARASFVFNAVQVDGFEPPPLEQRSVFESCAEAEEFAKATGAKVEHGAGMAAYNRKSDVILMPSRDIGAWPKGYRHPESIPTKEWFRYQHDTNICDVLGCFAMRSYEKVFCLFSITSAIICDGLANLKKGWWCRR